MSDKVWKFTMPKGWHLASRSAPGIKLSKDKKIIRKKSEVPTWRRYEAVKK